MFPEAHWRHSFMLSTQSMHKKWLLCSGRGPKFDLPFRGSQVKEATRQTKTERRILQTLYSLQTHGDMGHGKLATYEVLMAATICSRPALLMTCQRLVKEGKIVRRKINAADRKQWERQWPEGFARRQAHFALSPAMLREMEAEDDMQEWLAQERRGEVAGGQARRPLNVPDGGYSTSYRDNDRWDAHAHFERIHRETVKVQAIEPDGCVPDWLGDDVGRQDPGRQAERMAPDGYREDVPNGYEDRLDVLSDIADLPY